ncbi:DNA protecting protein DprA [Ruegeria halocynthiae]|uniref:DNA protecting protein DprA n=1 Tax=Ruegeria halocynthiae TaxID=985054 RepID=A0A1H2R2N3_9RHOB|nr:DNA-processing protein DprA [Ruegeria halocynthiae]SDW13683.1 DNA protecting protein DprA [Ruegeria halocynthiae]
MTEEQLSSNHPPLPPTTEEDRFSWLRLLRSRKVGPATFRRLLREHGSAQNALVALPEMARAAGIERYETCPPGVIEAELKAAKAAKARLLCLGAADYPDALHDIPDAPPMLWAIGDPAILQRQSIAMVGARNCSSLGSRMARALATDLGKQDYVVVSGLARGIDTAAHLATLATGTVAVMAGGVDVIYPAENADLARKIAETGLRLSEQPMGTTPQARHFPRRNRIISGLALAVVVVEAAAKSGSLITARDALDQGREVLAVPGHPFDARAAGCNLLIRDGATLVRSAEDVIEALPQHHIDVQPPLPFRQDAATTAPRALHEAILTRLGPSPIAEDQLIRDIAASAGEIGPILVDLELDGKIQRQPGGLLSLCA